MKEVSPMNTAETKIKERQTNVLKGVIIYDAKRKTHPDPFDSVVFADDAVDAERGGCGHHRDWELPANGSLLYVPKRAQRQVFGSS